MIGGEEWHNSSQLQFFTDAAASCGFGIYFSGRWAQSKWPVQSNAAGRSIAFLELFPIVVSLQLWGESLRNRRALFWSDNTAVVSVINSQSASCSELMKLVRELVVIILFA